eukprot:TRINITY_DN5608_c0_g1_i1.p1 TRINITY_DN5608_c0_g1~~TRINITY_DN5608_c0_g1_i1.p1  ORF type:complete len:149 (-),score=22.44 TRINITY_DN5608_c0_g1_i1:125-571(-)
MENNDSYSLPKLDELCIRAIEKNVEFVSQSSPQMQLLLQLPDELRSKIFEYFVDMGKVNDEIVSLFLPCVGTEVRFCDYVRLSDASLASVADKFGRQLKNLNVSGCFHITDVGMTVIGSSCPSLSILNISGAGITSQIGPRVSNASKL